MTRYTILREPLFCKSDTRFHGKRINGILFTLCRKVLPFLTPRDSRVIKIILRRTLIPNFSKSEKVCESKCNRPWTPRQIVEIQLHSSYNLRFLGGVGGGVGQRQALVALPRKRGHITPCIERWVAPERSERDRKASPPQGIDPWTV